MATSHYLPVAGTTSVLRHVRFSLDEDARWHRQWSRLPLGVAITDRPESADVLWNWINAWAPLAAEAAGAVTEIMSTAPEPLDAELSRQGIEASVSEEIDSLAMPFSLPSTDPPVSPIPKYSTRHS